MAAHGIKQQTKTRGPRHAFDKDVALLGMSIIVAFLAVRYGNQLLLWVGLVLLAVPTCNYIRHRWCGYKRWGILIVEFTVFLCFGYYMENSTGLFEDMPGMSLHAVIKIPSNPVPKRQYIVDFGSNADGEIGVYLAPGPIFTLSLTDRSGEPYDLKIPLGEGIPLDQFVYLVCDVGLAHNRTALRVSVNGSEIGRQEWPYKVNVGYITVKGGTLGSDISHTYFAAFEIAELAIYSSTLNDVDRERLREYIKDKYALPVRINRVLQLIGAFKPLTHPP